jgi:prepilin-type N-terminal cleavage/methylation domain-containing protein
MKAQRRHGRGRSGAFTLVELLVTISIIAVISSILVVAIRGALAAGYKARAQTETGNIASAIQAYFNEYGVYPTPDTNGRADHTFGGKGNNASPVKYNYEIMDILRARDSGSSGANPNNANNKRKIVFIEIAPASMAGTDAEGNTYLDSEGYYLDPWQNPYVVCMDTDFDGEIGMSGIEGGSGGNAFRDLTAQGRVADASSGTVVIPGVTVGVVSYGPDYRGNNNVGSNSVIFSWGKR